MIFGKAGQILRCLLADGAWQSEGNLVTVRSALAFAAGPQVLWATNYRSVHPFNQFCRL